jgi:hypothetical protein
MKKFKPGGKKVIKNKTEKMHVNVLLMFIQEKVRKL